MYYSSSMICKTYHDGIPPVRKNDDMSAPLRHAEVNCSSAQTEVLTGDPLLQLDNAL